MKRSDLALYGGKPVRHEPFRPHPVLGAGERKEVLSVLKTGFLSGFIAAAGPAFLGGPQVKRLESLVCRYFRMPHAVAMNSATSALHAALSALGIGPGDEVIVTSYTMSASASAILMQNAVPVFADIDERTFCLDPKEIEGKITPRTRAILVVHLFGQPAAMDEILAVARRHRLAVVEDCAQSPGARYRGKLVGTLGNIGVFSLNQHKTITTGEGGWAVTRDKRLALRMQLVRNHGEVVADHLAGENPGPVLGWNYRMTELEAAVGVAQFGKLDRLNAHRVRLARHLIRELSGAKGLEPPYSRPSCSHVYFLVAFRYNERKAGMSRDQFVQAMKAEGVPVSAGYVRPIYWEPIYRKKKMYERSSFPFNESVKYEKGDCPVAERMYSKELVTTNLCRYPLTTRDMDDVVRAIRKVLAAK